MAEIYGLECVCHPGRGIRYVGLTINSIQHRFKEHVSNTRLDPESRIGGLPVYRWMRKHGANNIVPVLLETCSNEDANNREVYWISALGTFTPNGMNMTQGGGGRSGYKLSPETRNQISRKKIGVPSSGKTKLSTVTVAAIKYDLWCGETISDTHKKFGVSKKIVKDINQGVSWNHVLWPIGPRQRMRTSELQRRNMQARIRDERGRVV